MKNSKKINAEKENLFPGLNITINPKLSDVNKSGSAKKIATAKKILGKVHLPSSFTQASS